MSGRRYTMSGPRVFHVAGATHVRHQNMHGLLPNDDLHAHGDAP